MVKAMSDSVAKSPAELTRRRFLTGAAAGGALCWSHRLGGASPATPARFFSQLGIVAPLERAAEIRACGGDYLIEAVARILVPDKPEAEFAPWRERVLNSELPALGCNYFLRDPRLRCAGPDADHPRVLAFAEIVFRRLREIRGEYVVLGNCGSRRLPPGWPKEKADEQSVALLQAMGPLAARHGVMVAVEQFNRAECNYLNHFSELLAVVSAASQPNIRVLADLYHMIQMDDPPADLGRGREWISMVEIAEKEKRTAPGVVGDNFRPYFAALAEAGYRGRIGIEAFAGLETANIRKGFAEIVRQSAEVSGIRSCRKPPRSDRNGASVGFASIRRRTG